MRLRNLFALSLVGCLALTACSKDDPATDDSNTGDDTSVDDTGEAKKDVDNDGYFDDEDCDDLDAFVYPGADETVADGTDSDCDGLELCYEDADGDGFGGEATVTSDSMDCSAAGVSATSEDCDDTDPAYNPNATEDDCTDPADYNCDGSTGYADADGDSWAACEECNDSDASIHPDAIELTADGVDQNCDGAEVCFVDADSDGYRNMDTSLTVDSVDMDCDDDGEGSATETTDDCDDDTATTYPGATEVWYDGVDADCAEDSDYDADGDGFDSSDYSGDDCDDTSASVNTSATDTAQNGIDEDCDGEDAPYAVTDLSAGDLIVTEIMKDSSVVTDANGEWFEIQNLSGGTVDLDGLYVYDDGGSAFTVSGELTVDDEGFVVFGINDDSTTNGGITVDYEYSSSWALGNSDDEINLAESSSKSTVIDEAAYDAGGQTGTGALWPDTAGYSLSLDSDHMDDDENDFGGHWCDASTATSGGDYGTPGATNDSCGYTYTFDADISTILNSSCSTCHTTSASGSLTSIGTWSSTVSVASGKATSYNLIEPFSADDSYLIMKIDGTHTDVTGGAGAQMPKGSQSISSANQTIVETWIKDGAPK